MIGLVCCLAFFVPMAIGFILWSEAQNLHSNRGQEGERRRLSLRIFHFYFSLDGSNYFYTNLGFITNTPLPELNYAGLN